MKVKLTNTVSWKINNRRQELLITLASSKNISSWKSFPGRGEMGSHSWEHCYGYCQQSQAPGNDAQCRVSIYWSCLSQTYKDKPTGGSVVEWLLHFNFFTHQLPSCNQLQLLSSLHKHGARHLNYSSTKNTEGQETILNTRRPSCTPS